MNSHCYLFVTVKSLEGAEYTIGIKFKVNNEIVSGLRYSQVVTRKGIKVDKMNLMVGSYAPRADDYTFTTEADEAPSVRLLILSDNNSLRESCQLVVKLKFVENGRS